MDDGGGNQDDYAALISALSSISGNQEKQQALEGFNKDNQTGHMVGKVYVGDSPLQHLGALGQLALGQGRATQDAAARKLFMQQLAHQIRNGGQAQTVSQSLPDNTQIDPSQGFDLSQLSPEMQQSLAASQGLPVST